MATYKVPQDVEAEDKLIGPFTFRQFVYLIIVAMLIFAAWGLAQVFIALALIPVPFILFFGALALPLRKDQPMETYLAAIVSFYLKPRQRKWDPDGVEQLVEITAPKVLEQSLTKDITSGEAERRLGYLAQIVDSQGWSVRRGGGVTNPNSSMASDVFFAAQQTEDFLDDSTKVSHSIDSLIEKSDSKRREAMIQKMHQPQTAATAPAKPSRDSVAPRNNTDDSNIHLSYSPYPSHMHQAVLKTDDDSSKPASTSPTPPSPDIIDLANASDVSVATISEIANRKKSHDDEIFVSLR